MSAERPLVVDTALHPVLGDRELRGLLDQPWASAGLPHPLGVRYAMPDGGFTPLADAVDDPTEVAEVLFGTCGVDVAVVTPFTRGLRPNPHEQAAIAHATNEWVARRWLDHTDVRGRFVGSIRLPMTDIAASLAELDERAGDPRFVQVAVPLRTLLPYGDEMYFPVWRAVAELGLPVGVYDDAATGVAFAETPVGPPQFFAEKHVLKPMAPIVHLSSLITSGVFDRLPQLRFVLADASIDLTCYMMWKIEKDWRTGRVEIPWVEKLPGSYLRDHVRIVSQAEDGTMDGHTVVPDLVEISDAARLVVFGSRFPFWDFLDPRTALPGREPGDRAAVLARNYLEVTPRLAALLDADGTGERPAAASVEG